jgi:hypothetical protein
MTLEKNVERMFWRLSNGNFKPNQNDLNAMTEITDWINREQESTLKHNLLLAKLYCVVFIQEIEYMKDINFAQRKIHDILNKTIETHYREFHEKLNTIELLKFSKKIGLSQKHPALMTEEERELDREKIKLNEKEFKRYALGIWEYEKVQTSLNNQITEAINHYKNLP